MRFITYTPNDQTKLCRKCHSRKPAGFFPKDRSRADGRWYTCRACNRKHWQQRGKLLALDRKIEQTERQSRTGLCGLRQYRRKNCEEFASVSPELRFKARQLVNKYLARHKHRLTPTLIASLYACAASNVKRLGDRSWARRLWWKKGYYRKLEREAEGEAERLCSSAIAVPCNPGGAANTSHGSVRSFPYL